VRLAPITDTPRSNTAMTDLGNFDGKDVLRTTIAVTNAGDGLSEALKVDPKLMHLDEKVYVVLECEVAKVRFEPIKDTDAVSRVHVLRAGNATLVDSDLVVEQLAEQAERIQRAKEAEAGISRLPYADELEAQHAGGGHADGRVAGCPPCDDEARAEADEIDDEPAAIGDR
jgi:hypothetical protein